ncbi:beta-carotene 3-hydroxylase [Marchantia polymorpha subsp. ruderalis]|uniref:beta-carotene 3-hydroxylase n=2 Tax=Marchantia polymorpha TaxID=3197 RepID=A0A176WMD1_MARPO|nr:hypothetical protein AXG93_1193s1080 [Marchantia polymorpha subsp. ruderalis]PTQ45363.1 hypothetical protein MARPO_0015s0152 [Marchantia polymorpha]BAR43283.1 beta-carotene hydroxylase [Marchantia polymorpha]BBN01596.1 hypothetical protein Mp_2g08670 [Marchantia polymorpha subsp. ruderalis]|eukprot:PTQ45363.1 hypothetical protein MARPO_0015s0152 [Marchantia polymorpha]
MLKVVASGATAVASLGVVRSGRECGRDGIGLEQLRHRALPSFPSLGLSSLEFNPLMTRTGIQRRIRIQRSIGPPSVLQIDEHQHGESPAPIEEHLLETEQSADVADKVESSFPDTPAVSKMQQRLTKRQTERKAYLLAAIASTTGFTTLAVAAVFYRFIWQMQGSGEIPYTEIFGTFALAVGAAVGMEYWARWAHKALWHASLWNMHESHHRPREGPFEMNDIFAIINAVPAVSLMLYGFLNRGLVPGLCFGAGLGITMFGIAYMFVHDGLVHRRFPVGPIADVPYLQKVAAAHQLHHADLYEGVPYGLFLGPKELEEVGGLDELERVMKQRAKPSASSK